MYLLQFALLYTLFYLAYRFVLVKTGQLAANRYYLLSIYVLALLLPLLPWPSLDILPESVTSVAPYVHTDVVTPSISTNAQLTERAVKSEQVVAVTSSQTDWPSTLLLLYTAGVLFFLLRYGSQLWSLRSLISKSSPLADHRWNGRARIIDSGSEKDTAFTYGPCFYVSPNLLNTSDGELILEHEYAHARQRHTIDLTISELFTALLWWHPITWLHRHDLRLNLEFLADRAVLQAGHPPKNYQLSLLRYCESFVAQPALTFAQSPLKTRIAMMKSEQRSTTIYFLLFVGTLLLGGFTTACSTQEADQPAIETSEVPFAKTFMGEQGWEQARSLLDNNYSAHQISYFVNGSPAQNEIIPKSQDIKIVELSANYDGVGKTAVSFTTLQSNWISAFGWHASEEKHRIKMSSYTDRTLVLLDEEVENVTDSYAMVFYGSKNIIEGAMDYLNEEYPDSGTAFYLDGEQMDIDVLKTPEEEIKAIVIAHTYSSGKRAIFHIITSAS